MNKRVKGGFENNWTTKSLEESEKRVWDEPEYNSYLVTSCHRLRKKRLKDFDVEDLRIMIGQNIGLKFLIPSALDRLEENLLAEGNFYKGDLLIAVLSSAPGYWREHKENRATLIQLFNDNTAILNDTETISSIRKGCFDVYSGLQKTDG